MLDATCSSYTHRFLQFMRSRLTSDWRPGPFGFAALAQANQALPPVALFCLSLFLLLPTTLRYATSPIRPQNNPL